MHHLSLTGDLGCPGRSMDEPDRLHGSRLRDVQSCRHGVHHEGMVHGEVWARESGIQMEDDTVPFLENTNPDSKQIVTLLSTYSLIFQ